MKRVINAVVIAGLLLASVGMPPSSAGEKDRSDPEKAGTKRLERLKEKLGLSDEQAGKFEAALKSQREEAKPLRRELRDSMIKLRDQVQDEAADKDVAATLERLERAKTALETRREKLRKELSALLTPRQRAMLLLAKARGGAREMKRGGKRAKGRRKHGWGGRRGGEDFDER